MHQDMAAELALLELRGSAPRGVRTGYIGVILELYYIIGAILGLYWDIGT